MSKFLRNNFLKNKLEVYCNWISSLSLFYLIFMVTVNVFEPLQLIVPVATVVISSYLLNNKNSENITLIKNRMELIDCSENIREISNKDIEEELEKLLENSSSWEFFGGTGTWQRKRVLPYLSSIKDRDVRYVIRIPNPFNDKLCDDYSSYRKKSRDQYDKTGEQISVEVLAFVILVWFYSLKSRIKADIYFNNHFSPIRIDGNSDFKILTVADPEKNGLFIGEGHWLNNSLVDDMNYRSENKIKIREVSGSLCEIDDISEDVIRDVLCKYFTDSNLLDGYQDLESLNYEKILKEIKNDNK